MKKIIYISIALTVLFSGCEDYDPAVSTSNSGYYSNLSTLEVLELKGYTLFVDAVEHAGIASELFASADTVTVFAPTNEAIVNFLGGLGAASITDIDPTILGNALRYHVSNDPFTSSSEDDSLKSLVTDKSVYPTYSVSGDGNIGLNGKAVIVEADLFSTDGVTHGISQVLSVPSDNVFVIIANSPVHTMLEALLIRVGLDDTLSGISGNGSFTVLAPDDAAFTDATTTTPTTTGLDLSDDDFVKELLRFHIIGGRTYQTELADGRIASILGKEANQQQELTINDGKINGREIDSDSANYNADNGVVHFLDAVISKQAVLENFLGGFATLNAAATKPLDYTSLDQGISILVNAQGSDANSPLVGDFANGDEIQDYLKTYTFDEGINFTSLASGTKIESLNDSEFYIQRSKKGPVTINGVDTLSKTASRFVYNGYVNELQDSDYPTPIPADDVTDILDASGYTLLAAMLRVTDKDDIADAQDVTFYAVSNVIISTKFGYTDPLDIDTLSAGGEEDVKITDKFSAFLDNQIVSGEIVSSIILQDDLPTQTLVSGETLSWGLIDASGDTDLELVVITNLSNPNSGEIEIVTPNIWANNGVIHEMEAIFPEPD